ncbi:MAG: aminotransferase class I/II-fold pyridoxal phosphate-dependent enzyme, partial [Hyphomicrobiaceae bacterium]
DPNEIDLIVGTLSKSLVTCGGFVCAREAVIEWLRYTLPGFVYSVGIPPMTAAAARSALSLIVREPERVARLHEVSRYFLATARRLGFEVGRSIGAGVVPVYFGDPEEAFLASEALLAAGIYVPPIVQIGIPKDMPRLRFFLSAAHTRADVDRVFSVLTTWRTHPGETGLQSSPLEPSVRGLTAADTNEMGLAAPQRLPSRRSLGE